MNDYDKLATSYNQSNIKPDKKYSILPTVMKITGRVQGKRVLDLGCGDGFFAREFSKRGAKVIGIDNSKEQLKLAREKSPEIKFILGDIFQDKLPSADIICSPFVLNYARSLNILQKYFISILNSLSNSGKAVFVVDLPIGTNLRQFGAVKEIVNGYTDGSKLIIKLYNKDKLICVLNVFYYKKETIEKLLKNSGFSEIKWHKPIVSQEAFKIFNKKIWDKYLENPELGYITVVKI